MRAARNGVTVAISPPRPQPYEVRVEPSLDLASAVSETLLPGVAAILTDANVGPLHGASAVSALESAGWSVSDVISVPAGEASKNVNVYERVLRELAMAGFPRGGTLFALGGGVVGDLGGFVASSYMRGIDLVQLPTSLLAMVDSSVGGKVGLDLPEGKNLVGAFLQPRLVAANLDWISTLPPREISNGLAEVVKMGLLAGGGFFGDLDLLSDARRGDTDALQALILHSVRFKAGVVERDERESGLRAILNYGHTLAHGLEAAAGFGLPHGEAVSVGMLAAARLSAEVLGTDLLETHEKLLRDAGLPLQVPAVDPGAVLDAAARDKKRAVSSRRDEYPFVLLKDIGEPVRDVPVPAALVRRVLETVVED